MDVSGAYDSLPHDKLLQVVTEVLFPIWNEAFVIRWWAQVWSEADVGMRKAFRRRVSCRYGFISGVGILNLCLD